MGTVGVQIEDLGLCCLPTIAEVCADSEGAVHNQQQQRSEALAQDDESVNVIQTKMFKRRRRATAVLDGDPGRALPPKCCDRCKSDLNGKLMVRCSTCSFRCHLYCFSPPLKQHPAFLIRRQQQRTGQHELNDTSPVWKCEKCEGTSVVFNVKPRPSSGTKSSKVTQPGSPVKRKYHTPAQLTATTATITEENTDGCIQPVQPQWMKNGDVVFDWYRFRSGKTEVLRHHEIYANQNRSGVNELVFYSKSYALMKKAAAIWRGHVSKRRQYRHHQEHEAKAISYPDVKYNVMRRQNSIEKSSVEVVNKDGVGAKEEDANLVDLHLTQRTPYIRRPPRLPLLWDGEPPSALMWWTTGERSDIGDILAGLEERVCLASEDVDVTFTTKDTAIDVLEEVSDINLAESNDDSPKYVNIHTAAVIIQRFFARRRLWSRRVYRANRQRRALEEAERRAKARVSIALLRTCIQFIVLLVRLLGQAQKKKAMLMVLRDAAEETQVKNNTLLNEQEGTKDASARERRHQLAVVRIRRFFMRRVHPYVKLKKEVMARRLQRWWKRRKYMDKWREAAIAIRHTHRNLSCSRIQKLYRQSRARARFRGLIETQALKTIRRVLTGWLLSRLAKKEAKRSAVYKAVQLSGTEEIFIPQSAPLDEILEKRGMELYKQGEFWNAASILERFCEMTSGKLTRELQQALAYSHHMTWYISYDQFNLHRAHELYCDSLEGPTNGERAARIDPLVLTDLTIVMMHMEHFDDSLRLLAKLIEYFARQPQFSLWLLLAAVQLQQRGEWEQSVGYLTYLHDIPPTPYLERDILALCAISYEQLALAVTKSSEGRTSYTMFAKEAWRAALRQWHIEQLTTGDVGGTARDRGNGQALTSRQKWGLLTNLGQRALKQGHYLLACRVYIYALERESPASDLVSHSYYDQEKQTVWWNLADAFRHLGHLDLYLNAAQRSQSSDEGVDKDLQETWRELASQQASSFETELRTLSVLEKLRQLAGKTG